MINLSVYIINITFHTHRKMLSCIICVICTITIEMVYWRIFSAWEKRNKSADIDFTPSVCVSFIDHGQQPLKMHTEIMLLYNA